MDKELEDEKIAGKPDEKSGQNLSADLRNEFRFSVRDRKDCWVVIENRPYPLCDLSYSGLGISARIEAALQIGQFLGDILPDCTLHLMQTKIPKLDYKMVHLSPDKDDRMICGFSWLNPVTETKQILASAIQQLDAESITKDDSGNN